MRPPSYEGRGITNLMAHLGAALGAPAGPCPGLDPEVGLELDGAETVILWVIDGLGAEFLAQRPGSALAEDWLATLDSVFPATTSAAITTFMTGQPPRGHGVTGWNMYVHELGAVTAWLPFGPRAGRLQWGDGVPGAEALLQRDSLLDRLAAEAHVVQPQWLIDTPYTRATAGERARRHGYEDLAGLVERVRALATEGGGRRRFVYAYWPDLDALCHQHGVASAPAAEHFAALDAAYRRLREALRGTAARLVVTADHGLVDTAPGRTMYLEDHPELAETLALPLCGEPRAAYCYLRPGAEAAFDAYIRERLGEVCELHTAQGLVEAGWFGPAPEHPQLRRRIGDRVVLPAAGWVLKDRLQGEEPFRQVGVHGGASPAEQRVPLIAAAA
ncbi:alkaline phosphatase family protein [Halorhodospira neutriphila]|uniref:Type I phosphodiesterase/nucleotide pyrophosphatase n=1 Tax=Halorhodospira neutriphila TaxID=168379 RepID=A0ABS1E7H5_9GAMM|nr:alkaline phosphatase family protein [Halorhodospira neutriphila]MBK1727686.1 hypothetical protein [Halorhodospira neutriphila]